MLYNCYWLMHVCCIFIKPFLISDFWTRIAKWPTANRRSRDRWRHVTLKVKVATQICLRLNISQTAQYSGLVSMEHHYTNSKPHNAERMITWPTTSTDLERSRLWPRYIWAWGKNGPGKNGPGKNGPLSNKFYSNFNTPVLCFIWISDCQIVTVMLFSAVVVAGFTCVNYRWRWICKNLMEFGWSEFASKGIWQYR